MKIFLGDQSDSKLLLGTYITTATPGLFKWQPGILTNAVEQGRSILIEDIDLAPMDVLAVLIPLLETGWLHIPSRCEKIRAKHGFTVFATKRIHANHKAHVSANHAIWTSLVLQKPDRLEIQAILCKRFPSLDNMVPLLINVFEGLSAEFEAARLDRQLTLFDCMKWCTRIVQITRPEIKSPMDISEGVFQEAYDCFLSMIASPSEKVRMCYILGVLLGMTEHRVEFYVNHYVPAIEEGQDNIQFGRVKMNKLAGSRSLDTFASTTQSIRILEKLATCIKLLEPVLLVGETGTGKTTVVQRMAKLVGQKITVINMSQQSDSSDLLGGFKPMDSQTYVTPVKEEFDRLFAATFSVKSNAAFIQSISKAYIKKKWSTLLQGFTNAIKMARTVFKRLNDAQQSQEGDISSDQNDKISHTQNQKDVQGSADKKPRRQLDYNTRIEWDNFESTVNQLRSKLEKIKSNFLFSFVEGVLVKAVKNGEWVLLDEINLASAETLECLSGLLESPESSLLLIERGDADPITRHANFRLFACMNPSNDAGKKELPPGLRRRFTEVWVDAPDTNLIDLKMIIQTYLRQCLPAGPKGEEITQDVADFYLQSKELARSGYLFDGADQRVHISLRTLTRALSYAADVVGFFGIRRSLYEGCFMTFMTGLGKNSFEKLFTLLQKSILNGIRNVGDFIRLKPSCPEQDQAYPDKYTLVDSFWLENGPLAINDNGEHFILTPSVQTNLANVSRGVFSRKYPILIQGPTSAGKTSIIEYLAKRTGHRFVRINNHEHTDIQEYLGGYVSNDQGVLVFQEVQLFNTRVYWLKLCVTDTGSFLMNLIWHPVTF